LPRIRDTQALMAQALLGDMHETLGVLRDLIVVMSHTETPGRIRMISMRRATRYEQALYFQNV
jgi:uncharacterized DUF497 family protein